MNISALSNVSSGLGDLGFKFDKNENLTEVCSSHSLVRLPAETALSGLNCPTGALIVIIALFRLPEIDSARARFSM